MVGTQRKLSERYREKAEFVKYVGQAGLGMESGFPNHHLKEAEQ